MKSCVTAKYNHYTTIVKHIKITGPRKLNRWRMTVLRSTRAEDGKGAASAEDASMAAPAEKVSLRGRRWAQAGLPLLLGLLSEGTKLKELPWHFEDLYKQDFLWK